MSLPLSEVSILISLYSDLQNQGDTIRRNHDERPPLECLSLISSSPLTSEPGLCAGSASHKKDCTKVAANEKTPSTVCSQPIGTVPTEVPILNDGGHGTESECPETLAKGSGPQDLNAKAKTKGKQLNLSKVLGVNT